MAGARRFQDLDAWKLANEVRKLAIALVEKPYVARNLKFCDQLNDASSSGARNIAEGFGRFRHREFVRLVRIARGSQEEVLDLFIEARLRKYLTEDEFVQHEEAVRRAMSAAAGLIRYLENSPDP